MSSRRRSGKKTFKENLKSLGEGFLYGVFIVPIKLMESGQEIQNDLKRSKNALIPFFKKWEDVGVVVGLVVFLVVSVVFVRWL